MKITEKSLKQINNHSFNSFNPVYLWRGIKKPINRYIWFDIKGNYSSVDNVFPHLPWKIFNVVIMKNTHRETL